MQPAQWFYAKDGRQVGPVSEEDIRALIRDGVIPASSLVWHAGLENWIPWNTLYPTESPNPAMPAMAPAYGAAPAAYVPGGVIYAGFWIRFFAYCLDGIIIGSLRSIVALPLGLTMLERPQFSPWFFIHLGQAELASLAISLFYFSFFLVQYGATPGKMILKLRVVSANGEPINFAQAVGRYFCQFLSWIICGIGFIMAAFDDQKRSLHDRLMETRVVHVGRPMF
jgi:uncharacterized RDD family membrane protein YckC